MFANSKLKLTNAAELQIFKIATYAKKLRDFAPPRFALQRLIGFILAILVFVPKFSYSQTVKLPSANDYAQMANITYPVMSPGGEYVAFGTLDDKGEQIVKIYNLETSVVSVYNLDKDFVGDNWIENTKNTPTKLFGLYFDAASHLYVSIYKTLAWEKRKISDDKLNLGRTILIDLKAKTSIEYLGSSFPSDFEYRTNVSDHYYTIEKWNDSNSLMKTDAKTHDYKIVGDGTPYTIDWLIDDNANPIARLDFDPSHKYTKVYVKKDKNWQQVLSKENYTLLAFELVGLSTSGKPIVKQTFDNENNEYSIIDLDTLQIKPFIKTDTLEIDTDYMNILDGHVTGIRMGGISPYWIYFDKDFKAIAEKLEQKYSNKSISIVANNAAKNRFIFKMESDAFPAKYYVYFAETERVIAIGSVNPKLDNYIGGSIFTEEVEARDKTKIPTYLTVSQQYEDIAKLPTIIIPRKAAESRDEPFFAAMEQFFASRGYLVIQPQSRGASGFGEKFRLSGVGELGSASTDDVIDIAKWAIKSGYSDPNRICILGRHLGSYVALQAMTRAPELFKCAIAYSPITDIAEHITFVNADYGYDSAGASFYRNFFDYPNTLKMQELSPVRNVEKVKGSILIFHGLDNTEIDITQSLNLVKKLKQLNKPHQYVEIKLGDSTLSRPEAKQTFFEESEKFLSQQIGPAIK